ncbi:hypothetical protein BGZ74_003701 [Mortierella antarctica]|nr:hypothetical protein BGZ74_003701 [Mortierella antarctica]
MPVSVQVTPNSSGLKIRIPRDLPNLPEVFRKRGAIRSIPMSTGSSQGTIKRTHSQMMLGEPNGLEEDPRNKIAKGLLPIPSHLANANVKNLAIRTSPNPIPAPSSPATGLSMSESKKQQPLSSVPQRHRSDSKSKSSSPVPTPVRFPTPPSSAPRSSEQGPSSIAPSHSHGTRSAAETTVHGVEGGQSSSTVEAASPASTSSVMEVDPMELKPLELVRVGLGVLNRLVSNTYCKSFINKVPQSAATYHVVIKKPMDLTTIEQKLWKTLELASSTITISRVPPSITKGYLSLNDLEKDLRRIFQNATFFNSPGHTIYKEAQQYQSMYLLILNNYRQGPLYLFRAHTLREMDRKMTDISTDLFATFHQPIFDLSEEVGSLSPEHPAFVRMYINKNRSVLVKCRDEQFAKVAILSDIVVGKPYYAPAGAGAGKSPVNRNKSSSGPMSVNMVNITAKVLIGKPIGERHDMVTVGDLDCPNAWISVACVKVLHIDVEVPVKFEKGTLAKMRHEVVPFTYDRNNPTLLQDFVDALGVVLPGSTPRLTPPVQKSVVIPAIARSTGLGITTASAPASPGGANRLKNVREVRDVRSGRNQHRRSKSSPMVEVLNEQGAQGRLLIKLKLPSLKTAPSSPMAPAPASAQTITPSATEVTVREPTSSVTSSTSSTPLLSSQVVSFTKGSPEDSTGVLSAPDVVQHTEHMTKRAEKMLECLKTQADEKKVPYISWKAIEPTLTVDSAHGLFKRIYHVKGDDSIVVQNFKEMDVESFEQRVREVACLLKLRGLKGVGQIQSVIDNEDDHLVGLSMTKYEYTLKAYATNARRHPSPCQKLCLIQDMVSAMAEIHSAGLAHRDLSEVNIMVDEDPSQLLEDQAPRPLVRVIDFGKSVFVGAEEVQQWSMKENIDKEELDLLPLVVLPPDHGYKLYRSILTLPKTKHDHSPLPPVDPRSEDVYSLGVLIWRTFSGKSPWNGAIEDDLKTIRYLVASDAQIKFQLEKEVQGEYSRALLLKCLTANPNTRWSCQQLKGWLEQPEVGRELLREFEALGGGRKKLRKSLD